ncbi:NCS2 family permease [Alkaliphilus peptidifermentans]|uniref:Putative MFS transporter, AGZA family, xanthine/uracil permease n=1 Tax=Alkaliphilus peptidifermentans DSM 18978 TaxID=1120976 RepID=A0A1G5IBB6_9FIRM|nr:NCS2 family permease [Alkaliphilus peptidifermentans]SCY72608.1 putative MFS transporter, AGZA family, xanthine/uracil permease [Alkaliphilus peptidifermentans DSM 18978]
MTKGNTSFLDSKFRLTENNTNVKTEIIAGITTFITMAYILFVNPDILSAAGMDFNAVFMATCISAAIGTLIMGLYANLPFAQAPGMGLNAFFTYGVVLNLGYTWQQALAAIFISGILFIILTVTGAREAIVEAIPHSLKHAIGGGIGLFIALIGFKNAGIVVASPATLVEFGNFADSAVILAVIGLVITGVLMARRMRGAILIGIVATTLLGIPLGVTSTQLMGFSFDITPTLFKMDFIGLLDIGQAGVVGALTSVLTVVISFSLVDMFDTIGTLIGTGAKAGMLDEKGKLPNMNKALLADAVATSAGAMLGTSTVTTYVESAAGVAEGGKTGLTATTTGVLFILAIFLAPFALMVPPQATAPALIVVGVLMMGAIKEIDFDDFAEAMPAFLTIAVMPFSFSIANGIAAGIIFYCITKLFTGKAKDIHPTMILLAILFILRFTILPH